MRHDFFKEIRIFKIFGEFSEGTSEPIFTKQNHLEPVRLRTYCKQFKLFKLLCLQTNNQMAQQQKHNLLGRGSDKLTDAKILCLHTSDVRVSQDVDCPWIKLALCMNL